MERKLSDLDAVNIRAAHIKDHPRYGSKALAEIYCVSRSVIERLINRDTYRHIPARTVPPPDHELIEFLPDLVGVVRLVPLVVEGVSLGSPERLAEEGETPDLYMTADKFYGVNQVHGRWIRKEWHAPSEAPKRRITLVEFEQEARLVRGIIYDLAKARRKALGLAVAGQRIKA